MRTYINQLKAQNPSPCDRCDIGWGSYSCGEDEKGQYVETETCHDNCVRFKEYLKSVKEAGA